MLEWHGSIWLGDLYCCLPVPNCPAITDPRLNSRTIFRPSKAAADTLAMSSLEVDLSGIEEGSTVTVKWRGKPVFIKHRTADEVAAQVAVPMSDLKDPQADVERSVDPKVGKA